MNTQYIPTKILNNPYFDFNDTHRINELNEMFSKLENDDIKNLKEYKTLIDEINLRINAEHKKNESIRTQTLRQKQLDEAKKELQELTLKT